MANVRRLIGVYNARGGARGEIAYVLGRAIGRAHCGLCDVTHGLRLRPRAEWVAQRSRLGVPFDVYHVDDRPADVARACPRTPCIVAETEDGLATVLGPEEIDACRGDPAALVTAAMQAAATRGLRLGA